MCPCNWRFVLSSHICFVLRWFVFKFNKLLFHYYKRWTYFRLFLILLFLWFIFRVYETWWWSSNLFLFFVLFLRLFWNFICFLWSYLSFWSRLLLTWREGLPIVSSSSVTSSIVFRSFFGNFWDSYELFDSSFLMSSSSISSPEKPPYSLSPPSLISFSTSDSDIFFGGLPFFLISFFSLTPLSFTSLVRESSLSESSPFKISSCSDPTSSSAFFTSLFLFGVFFLIFFSS